jgi:peptidoglycan hydrolase CwlO-like protein
MTTATLTDEATYCDCCDEEATILLASPDDPDFMLCPACHAERMAEVEAEAKQEALDQAEELVNDADADVESIEGEISDLQARFKEEMAELRERLAEAKRTAKAARRDLAKLSE